MSRREMEIKKRKRGNARYTVYFISEIMNFKRWSFQKLSVVQKKAALILLEMRKEHVLVPRFIITYL